MELEGEPGDKFMVEKHQTYFAQASTLGRK